MWRKFEFHVKFAHYLKASIDLKDHATLESNALRCVLEEAAQISLDHTIIDDLRAFNDGTMTLSRVSSC